MYVILKDLIETNKMQKNIVPSLSYDFLNRDLLVITLRAKPENRLSGEVVSLLPSIQEVQGLIPSFNKVHNSHFRESQF